MKVQANTLRPGHVIEHQGRQYAVVKYELILPGKGNAFIAVDMRDVQTGIKTNERWRTAETVEKLMTDEITCTLLFSEDDRITLMDTETYDQFTVPKEMAGDAAVFLSDGMEVMVDRVEGTAAGVRPPQHVTLEVAEADAVFGFQLRPERVLQGRETGRCLIVMFGDRAAESRYRLEGALGRTVVDDALSERDGVRMGADQGRNIGNDGALNRLHATRL